MDVNTFLSIIDDSTELDNPIKDKIRRIVTSKVSKPSSHSTCRGETNWAKAHRLQSPSKETDSDQVVPLELNGTSLTDKQILQIRDDIIPNNKVSLMKQYLNLYEEHLIATPKLIELFYGCAIIHSDVQIIALLNLFVRENKIKIDKGNLLEEICWAEVRYEYANPQYIDRCIIHAAEYKDSEEIRAAYSRKYRHMFSDYYHWRCA